MELRYTEVQGIGYVEGQPSTAFMREAREVNALIEACLSNRTGSALLYASNLSPGFFDVSSREAGEVLQKLRMYRIQLAIVRERPIGESQHFGALLAAERRDGHFGLFDDRSAAEAWLCDRERQGQAEQ